MSNSYFKKTNSTISSIINSLPKTGLNSLKTKALIKTKALKPLTFLIWHHHFFFVRSPLKCDFVGMTPNPLNGDPYITHHVSNFSNEREVSNTVIPKYCSLLLSFSTIVLSVKIDGINFKFLEWWIVSRIALKVSLPLNIEGNLKVIGGNLTNLKYYYVQEKNKPWKYISPE